LTLEDADSKKFLNRFLGRAKSYSRYRPGYPAGVLAALESEIGFDKRAVVADIGSGTGILSELFLRNGNKVYCVEPNRDMRKEAEERLGGYGPRWISVDGTAEATGLRKGSVDLVAAGQALHWFDGEKARAEFARLLKKEGHVAIVYNQRSEGEVEEAYERIVARFQKDIAVVPDVDDAYVARFLNDDVFRKLVMPNSQSLDFEGMIGRLGSASYMPPKGDGLWTEIGKEVRKMIDVHGVNGVATLHYDTVLYIGRIVLRPS